MSGQPIREEGDVTTLLRLGVLCDGKKRSNRVEGRQVQLRETHLLGRREVEHQIGFDEGLGRDVKEGDVLSKIRVSFCGYIRRSSKLTSLA